MSYEALSAVCLLLEKHRKDAGVSAFDLFV